MIETEWGTVMEKTPIVYQMDGARRTAISGTYAVAGSSSLASVSGQSMIDRFRLSLIPCCPTVRI
jgi:hypothetical protein